MVSVYAPASIGNVGVGFDLLGAAVTPVDGSLLGDVISIGEEVSDDFQLEVVGPFKSFLPQDAKDNVVYQCSHWFRDALIKQSDNADVPFVAMTLDKRLPVGSGLGSSATSIVAAFCALNEYFGMPFGKNELMAMMGHFEAKLSGSLHYDNVAPCYLGGLQLMTEDEAICASIPVPQQWYWVMAYSGISVSTKMAREVLPKQLSMATAKTYAKNLAAFIDAMHKGLYSRAAGFINDVVAEPHRIGLLPGFAQAREQLLADGALACGISGSGPTVFAIADSLEKAEQFQQLLIEQYLQNEQGFCLVCRIDSEGARVLPNEKTHEER